MYSVVSVLQYHVLWCLAWLRSKHLQPMRVVWVRSHACQILSTCKQVFCIIVIIAITIMVLIILMATAAIIASSACVRQADEGRQCDASTHCSVQSITLSLQQRCGGIRLCSCFQVDTISSSDNIWGLVPFLALACPSIIFCIF